MSTSNGLIDRVDSIAIVEAAYVEAANNQQWLRGLLDAVGQGVEHVASMAAVLVTAEPPRVVDIVGSHGLQPKDLAQAIQCDVGKYTNVWRMSPLSMASTQSSTMVNQLGSTRLLRTHALEPTDYLAPAIIVLENVAADDLSSTQQERLQQYVRDLGGSGIHRRVTVAVRTRPVCVGTSHPGGFWQRSASIIVP